MGRVSIIEERLKAINETVFQELCDQYLILTNPSYKTFSRSGSQLGKQKTTIGTPDSFVLLPDETYLFVETTTQQKNLLTKLKKDITNCLNEEKTNVPLSKIREIILCFNSKLTTIEVEKITDFAKLLNIRTPKLISLSELATQISLHYRNLAKDYLDLSLDSGQIVSLVKFVEHYNGSAQMIATTLDNPFLHRVNELRDFLTSIHANDLVVLYGPPGVGKTKLAIEGITQFIKNNPEYNGYAILNRHYDILEDLSQYFDHSSRNILFIDDANRIDRLTQIVGFTKGRSKGELKIVITVRDYALDQLRSIMSIKNEIGISGFTSEEIIEIISNEPFNIKNADFQQVILRIAGNNPRLAIMASRIALEKNKLSALYEVYDLFDQYFITFIQDNDLLKRPLFQKVLGILAFFNILPIGDSDLLHDVLAKFSIDYGDFMETIDKLESIELVEIKHEHVKISEQTLSIYFFYKTFIRDEILSIDVIFKHYYENQHNRIRDTIIPSNNTFGYRDIRDKLRPSLLRKLESLASDEVQLIRFYNLFWFYLEGEAFEFIYRKIISVDEPMNPVYIFIDKKPSSHHTKADAYLKLIERFLPYPDYHKRAIDLGFEYARKFPPVFTELINVLKGVYAFDYSDEHDSFARQKLLFELIFDNIEKSNFKCVLFFELANPFLRFQFEHGKPIHGGQFSIYRYPLVFGDKIIEFRKKIWDHLDVLFDVNREQALKVVDKYQEGNIEFNHEIILHDLGFILGIIAKNFNQKSFHHCFVVQKLLHWLNRIQLWDERLNKLKAQFTNQQYEWFKKLDFNRLRNKEQHEYKDWNKFVKVKEREIRQSFIFKSAANFILFKQAFFEMAAVLRGNDSSQLTSALTIILDENFKQDNLVGFQIIDSVIRDRRLNDYIPFPLIANIAQGNAEQKKEFWNLISGKNPEFIDLIDRWKLEYLLQLPESEITKSVVSDIFLTVMEFKYSLSLFLGEIEKFKTSDSYFCSNLLEVIIDRNKINDEKIAVDRSFIEKNHSDIDDVDLLKQTYLQQDNIQQFFDYDGVYLLIILKRDNQFLIEYLEFLSKQHIYVSSDEYKCLNVVWELDDPSTILLSAVSFIVEEDGNGLDSDFVEAFFNNLSTLEAQAKADSFLLECIDINKESSKIIDAVFSAINNCRPELFATAFRRYLELNADVESFKLVSWIEKGVLIRNGEVNVSDENAAKWCRILVLLDTFDVGIALIPIRNWLVQKIESEKSSGDRFRRLKYLGRW